MVETLMRKIGPLPVWAWALIFTAVVAWYIRRQQSKQAAQSQQNAQQGVSSNLQCVPVSNMTTAAQPMPIQLGDTFVSTGQGGGVSTTSGSPVTTVIGPPTASNSMQPATTPSPSPATNV